MPRIALLVFILFSALTLMGCNDPVLTTTSDGAYKETLKKIFDSQSSEEKRLEISQGILFVVTNGSEVLIERDSSNAYALYNNLEFMGNQGRLMVLDGKTAAEIIAVGDEVRKKWALDNLPAQIANYKKRIDSLEKKQTPEAALDEYDKERLVELREKLTAAEAELQKYK